MKSCNITAGLSDSRQKTKIVYSFDFLIFSSLCAVMSGEDSFTGISDYVEVNKKFFSDIFDIPDVTPTHDTYARLFEELSPDEFDSWFVEVTKRITQAIEDQKNMKGLSILPLTEKQFEIALKEDEETSMSLTYGQAVIVWFLNNLRQTIKAMKFQPL